MNRYSVSALVLVLISLVSYWLYFVAFHPISFWGVDEEATIMALAEAVNIDFWFLGAGPRSLSQAQIFQPGMPFQIISWLIYRLPFWASHLNPTDLFKTTIMQPASFWFAAQIVPVILTILCLIYLWRRSKDLDGLCVFVILTGFFVSMSAIHYGVFMFWNESLSLPLSMLFFIYAQKVLTSKNEGSDWGRLIFCGLLGALLYMHKMNYVVTAAALVPALITQSVLRKEKWLMAGSRVFIYLGAAFVSLQAVGRSFLGNDGFRQMLTAHGTIFWGNGIYGSGEKTIVSKTVILQNLQNFYAKDPFALLFIVYGILCVVGLTAKRRKDQRWLKEHLPEAVLFLAAISLMTLAILKHFQPHYVISVIVIFPLFLTWLARNGARKVFPYLVPLILIALCRNAVKQAEQRAFEVSQQQQSLEDEQAVLRMPLAPGEERLWMYRSVVPTFARMFVVDFSGVTALQDVLVELQGKQRLISPWLSAVLTKQGYVDAKDLPWRYIVVPKVTLEQGWINKEHYFWLEQTSVRKTELKQNVIYQREL